MFGDDDEARAIRLASLDDDADAVVVPQAPRGRAERPSSIVYGPVVSGSCQAAPATPDPPDLAARRWRRGPGSPRIY